jgi:RNA polymerase sigma-70 factor (ECF subfamily)
VDSTVGGVKAALSRGRTKLTIARDTAPVMSERPAAPSHLLSLYVERFNRQDWDGLRELIAADATLRVADRFAGRLADSSYFRRYARLTVPWRLTTGEIDGESTIIVLGRDGSQWQPQAVVRLTVVDDRITHIADYCHCPWIVPAVESLVVDRPS